MRDNGDAVALLEGVVRLDIARFWTEDRFDGFGTSVIFAEDFRKPACPYINPLNYAKGYAQVIHRSLPYQPPSTQWLQNSFAGPHCQHSIFDVMSNRLARSGGLEFCICWILKCKLHADAVCQYR